MDSGARWDNRWVPTDEPTIEGDSASSDERPADPATLDEMPADAAGLCASVPEATSQTPMNGEASPQGAENDKPEAELESKAEPESDADDRENTGTNSSSEFGEQMLALERARDAQGNIDTRPPDAETVAFRSVTIAEVYAGQAVDSLMTALDAINWVNFHEPISREIAVARKGGIYYSGHFLLVSSRSESALYGYGQTDLPSRIDRIYCDYHILGPSITAMVLTFVLTADETRRMDKALREDAESRLDRTGARFSTMTVRDVKRELVRGVRDQVVQRCCTWLKSRMPGTLSATKGAGLPACTLVSLAVGKPFDTQAEYMTLLGLRHPFLVEKFARHDFLFLVHVLIVAVGSPVLAVFNEADAVGSGWLRDPEDAPGLFHREISSLMTADGLNSLLQSFELRLRNIRADLNRLDIDKAAGNQVISLRNQLLGLAREISAVGGDVTGLVDGTVTNWLWADFSPLAQVRRRGFSSRSVEITANTKRQQLHTAVESLQAQEVGLRELILVTTSAVNETRTLNLTKTLNRLTLWLVFLTIAVLVVAIVQLVNSSTETTPQAPASPAVSRTPRPAPRTPRPAPRTPRPAPRTPPSSSGPASKTRSLGSIYSASPFL